MNDELSHYGVKGMKWGVRKSESTNSNDANSAGGGGDSGLTEEEAELLNKYKLGVISFDELTPKLQAAFNNEKSSSSGDNSSDTKKESLSENDVEFIKAKAKYLKGTQDEMADTIRRKKRRKNSGIQHSDLRRDDTLYLAHHGVKGMKWGVRKSPSERASAKSLRYAKKAAKLQKKVAKLKKRELKNTKKELKAIYRGNIKGERTYKRRRVVASVKAAKKDAKAAKFTAKSQKMLRKSMQLKANEVDQQTKDVGRKQIDKIIED